MSKTCRIPRLLPVAITALLACSGAMALTVTATHVKTLGQSFPTGKFAIYTGGGRIAVDNAGNAYFGTPGGGSYLQKVAPDGKILWQVFTNAPGYQATAVDDKYLYTTGSGYILQVLRWDRETGVQAPGWILAWRGNEPLDGAAPLKYPVAMVVDDRYLYIADRNGNEIRRFDKTTGKEVGFANRLQVIKPIDLAFTPEGTLLILTESAVVETDTRGKPLRVPVISGLDHAVALEVSRKTGAIYVAEGGAVEEPINRIRMFAPAGKRLDTEIGIGGDFNGKWHPLSFAFSSGEGDITLDPKGGLWVNGFGNRMFACPLLTHLTPGPAFTPDLTLRGAMSANLAVDPNLDVYVGGPYKIGWDNTLRWTSGLASSGAMRRFPTTLVTWAVLPVWSDGVTAVFAQVHGNIFYQVNARSGVSLEKTLPGGGGGIPGACAVGREIFYTGAGRTIQRTTVELTPPQPFMTLPEEVTPREGNLAVTPDLQRVYVPTLVDGAMGIACCRRDGTIAWKVKGILGALHGNVLFTDNPAGYGIVALDAATGERVALFGDKEEDGRPPIHKFQGMAVGSKDGATYLFMLTNGRIFVYRVTIA